MSLNILVVVLNLIKVVGGFIRIWVNVSEVYEEVGGRDPLVIRKNRDI